MMTLHASVLVVDDDDTIRNFVRLSLEDEGYEVLTARDGSEALALAQQHHPSVILLDMRMPGMDGWTFSRAYDDTPFPHAPVIVMTAEGDARARSFAINANGCLSKPFDLEELLPLIGRYTGNADRYRNRQDEPEQ